MSTPTIMAIAQAPSAYVVGTPFEFQVRVHADVAMPSVPVHFYLDGVDIGSQWTSPLVNPTSQTGGYTSFIYMITVSGPHILMAAYLGSATYAGSSISIAITDGGVSLTPTTLSILQLPTTFTATVAFEMQVRLHAAIPMPSVPIHFYVDGVDVGTRWTGGLTDPDSIYQGRAAWTITVPTSGGHTLRAAFLGNDAFSGSEVMQNISVSPSPLTAVVSYSSDPVSISCTINGTPVPSGSSAPFNVGDLIAIAVPAAFGGYVFSHWEDLSISPSRAITLAGSIILTAYYLLAVKRIVNYFSSPIAVAADIGGISIPSGQGIQVDNGTVIQINVPAEVIV